MNQIKEFTLENGLKVLLKEIHSVPVISLWVWYRVGSRNERPGNTGSAHWIEHLLGGRFTYEGKKALNFISQLGGVANASTFYDYTNFYATLPAERVEVALRMEAERMRQREFDPNLIETERQVIITEQQWKENEPPHRLYESLLATAFQIHPYRQPVIGYLCDLQNIPVKQLQEFHNTYYVPNNAFVVAVGAFKTGDLLKQIDEHMGSIKPEAAPPQPYALESVQTGERRVTLHGEGATSYLQMAFHIPETKHPDFVAISVLSAILSGAGPTNATSRLYRSLIDTELAVNISCNSTPTIDPYLIIIDAIVRTGRKLQEVEQAIDAQLKLICAEPVNPAELQKAIKQAKAQFAYGSESVTNQGLWYGWSEIFANYTWFENYLDGLASVTPDDIQRVAQQYLNPHNRTVAYYIPNNNKER